MASSWMAERDRLLAQANSLVKTVSAARPAPSSVTEKPHDRPLTPQPRPASAAPTPFAPASRARPINEGEADHQPLSVRRNLRSEPQAGATIPIPILAGNERDDIEIRVARFRERQTKLAMERQAQYERTQRELESKLLRDDDYR